jgi:hypothetical protein
MLLKGMRTVIGDDEGKMWGEDGRELGFIGGHPSQAHVEYVVRLQSLVSLLLRLLFLLTSKVSRV